MKKFNFSDANRFRALATESDYKLQTFLGIFLGVILHWIYQVALEVIVGKGVWDFGGWPVVIARVVVALIVTLYVFSGYWESIKDNPPSLRFISALAYGLAIDSLVAPWTR